MRYFLDSTFVIDFLRGDEAAVGRYRRIFDEGDEPVVNEIVVCEVATGSPNHPDAALSTFLGPVEFIQPGRDVAFQAAEWRADARRRGLHLSLADSLIAAAADATDAMVLTRNVRHFALTPVRVQEY